MNADKEEVLHWMPVVVPLFAAAVLGMQFLVWSLVL